METLENVLARRYTSPELKAKWLPLAIHKLRRLLWTTSLDSQRELGAPITSAQVNAYVEKINGIDLASIAKREAVTKHDVVAEKQEFDAQAGLTLAHRGFTSRDLTDNVEQILIFRSLLHIHGRSVAVLDRLRRRADEWKSVLVCGRSHRQTGQVTTYGKRMATIAEEFLIAFDNLEHLIASYTFRGFKGAMGTGQDLIHTLGGIQKYHTYERDMMLQLAMRKVFQSTGQVYPRSLDFQVVAVLFQLGGALGTFQRLIRDGAQLRHLSEGFSKGRKGSSAMPHKQNPSKAERIHALLHVLGGHLDMAKSLVGSQEFEGDVSCSVTRRVIFPDAFFAIDGIIETALTILDDMHLNPAVIERELKEEMPFLATTRIRTESVGAGADDSVVYAAIQEHAIAASERIANGEPNDLLDSLAQDPRIPFDRYELLSICAPDCGDAVGQTRRVVKKVERVIKRFDPKLTEYVPQTRN